MPSPILQFKSALLFLSPGVDTITLDQPVTAGSILVAFSVLNTFNETTTPTDTQGNDWQGPFLNDPPDEFPFFYPAWYAVNVAAGSTSVTLPGLDILNDSSGAWTIVLEIAGWTEFDGIQFNSSDPPDEEILTSPTTSDDDIIICIWGGPNQGGGTESGLTKGAESTLIDTEVVPYAFTNWSVLVQYRETGAPGDYESTGNFDTDVTNFRMGMALAFKKTTPPPIDVPYTQIPLSTDDVLIWTSNSELSPYIPRIEFFDKNTKEWVIATTANFFVDPQQILSTWEQGGIYRAVKIADAVVVQWFSELTQEWVSQYLVDPDFVRPDPSGAPAGPLLYP